VTSASDSVRLQHSERAKQRWGLLVVLLLVLVALVVGLGLFEPWPWYGDEGEYVVLADAYRAGLGHRMVNDPNAPVNLPAGPALPAYLAGVYAVFGRSWVSSKLAVLIGFPLFAAALGGLFLRRFHVLWAALGVLAVCLSYRLAEFSAVLMTEIPFLLVITVGLLAVGRYSQPRGGGRALILTVVCVALAYFLREAGIAFGIAVLFWLLLRRHWRAAGVVLAACALCPLVWHTTLAVQSKHVGQTFGRAHLESFSVGAETDPLPARAAAVASDALKTTREMVSVQLPELLRATRYYQRMFNGRWQGRVCSYLSLLFFAVSMAGALLLLWRRPEGAIGAFVLTYVLMLILYRSYVRYLVPVYPFMIYTGMHFLDEVFRARRVQWMSAARSYAAGAALVVALQVVGLHGLDIHRQARIATRARAHLIPSPHSGQVAAARAAEWAGLGFGPRAELIGSRKEMNAYVSSQQYARRFPVTKDMGLFVRGLDRAGITLLLEDDYNPDSTGPLRDLLAQGEGKHFRLLCAVYEGRSVARIWRYMGAAQRPWLEPAAPGDLLFALDLQRNGPAELARPYDIVDATVTQGVLDFKTTGSDPQFELLSYPPERALQPPLELIVEMDATTPGRLARIYYDTGTGYREDQALSWELRASSGFASYILPIYLKQGERIRRVRFDPTDAQGQVRIRRLAVIRPHRLPW